MKRSIVIKVHPIGSTKNTAAKTPEKNSGPLYKVLPLDPQMGITGRPLEDLRPGDMMFLSGSEQHIIMEGITVKYIDDFPTDEIYIRGTDGSMHLLSEFVVVNEPASGAAPGESWKSDAPITKDEKSANEHCDRLIKVKKDGSTRITGCLFSELKPGDIFYRRGKAVGVLDTGKNSLIDTALTLCYPEDADDWDAYEPAEAPQVDTQDTARNAGPSESRESDASTTDDSRIVKGVKKGTAALTGILFRDLKVGDTFFQNGKPITVGEDAHLSGDASYDGYLVYDRNGNGYFPEDADLFEIQPQEASTNRTAENLAFNNAQKATMSSTRGLPVVKGIKKGTTALTGLFFQELEKDDIFFRNGEPVMVYEGAHKSCDDYVVCDKTGKSYFFEDVDLYSLEDMAKNMDYDRVVKAIKINYHDGVIRGCLYKELKPGDFFFYQEQPIGVKDLAGTFVGSDGVQYNNIVRSYADRLYLPGKMDPYVPEKARSDKPAGKGSCDNDRILVKRKGALCSIFSHNLNVGDVVTAINANALMEEDFDRCAIVRRDGALATITVSDLQVNDKVLALL